MLVVAAEVAGGGEGRQLSSSWSRQITSRVLLIIGGTGVAVAAVGRPVVVGSGTVVE